jgi:hypothetical protein
LLNNLRERQQDIFITSLNRREIAVKLPVSSR